MEHALAQMTISVGAPPEIAGEEGRRRLARFYGGLLGMQVIRKDWLKIAVDPESALHVALDGDGWSDYRPPRWPDPDFPQQIHLDLLVGDVATAGMVVDGLGGRPLRDRGDRRVYADPAGHPFCLYPSPDLVAGRTVIGRVMLDCLSPRSLATFYEGLFGTRRRLEDAPTRVVLALDDERFPDLGFQHATRAVASSTSAVTTRPSGRSPPPSWRSTTAMAPASTTAHRAGTGARRTVPRPSNWRFGTASPRYGQRSAARAPSSTGTSIPGTPCGTGVDSPV